MFYLFGGTVVGETNSVTFWLVGCTKLAFWLLYSFPADLVFALHFFKIVV